MPEGISNSEMELHARECVASQCNLGSPQVWRWIILAAQRHACSHVNGHISLFCNMCPVWKAALLGQRCCKDLNAFPMHSVSTRAGLGHVHTQRFRHHEFLGQSFKSVLTQLWSRLRKPWWFTSNVVSLPLTTRSLKYVHLEHRKLASKDCRRRTQTQDFTSVVSQ